MVVLVTVQCTSETCLYWYWATCVFPPPPSHTVWEGVGRQVSGSPLQQGWEFAHRFSERIPRFLRNNEQMGDSLKKRAIPSFAHFWWATWAICSWSTFLESDLSESLMVAHFWWAAWAIRSQCSFLVSDPSDSLTSLIKKDVMSKSLFFIKNVHI